MSAVYGEAFAGVLEFGDLFRSKDWVELDDDGFSVNGVAVWVALDVVRAPENLSSFQDDVAQELLSSRVVAPGFSVSPAVAVSIEGPSDFFPVAQLNVVLTSFAEAVRLVLDGAVRVAVLAVVDGEA